MLNTQAGTNLNTATVIGLIVIFIVTACAVPTAQADLGGVEDRRMAEEEMRNELLKRANELREQFEGAQPTVQDIQLDSVPSGVQYTAEFEGLSRAETRVILMERLEGLRKTLRDKQAEIQLQQAVNKEESTQVKSNFAVATEGLTIEQIRAVLVQRLQELRAKLEEKLAERNAVSPDFDEGLEGGTEEGSEEPNIIYEYEEGSSYYGEIDE